jgi:hypothetical protein
VQKMAEKVKQKTGNQTQWINYHKVSGKTEIKKVGFIYGQIFTY